MHVQFFLKNVTNTVFKCELSGINVMTYTTLRVSILERYAVQEKTLTIN
jgi:hypothetical protein